MSRPPGDLRPGRPERQLPGQGSDRTWRIVALAILGLFVLVLLVQGLSGGSKSTPLSYGDFINQVQHKGVLSAKVNNDNGHISGKLNDAKQTSYSVNGPHPLTDSQYLQLKDHVKNLTF